MAWLSAYLASAGGWASSADIREAGQLAGHTVRTLERAAERLKLDEFRTGFPSTAYWGLPGFEKPTPAQSRQVPPIHEVLAGLAGLIGCSSCQVPVPPKLAV